jgi:hypothetical protein
MSLAQQLLLRALVAWFWRNLTRRAVTRLTRWGTGLHDRFLLPTFVQMDFDDVHGRAGRGRLRLRPAVVRAALRVPLPAHRRAGGEGISTEPARRARALARDGRRGRGRRHGALCRLVAGAAGGQGQRAERQPACVTVNGQPLPLQPTGPGRRVRRRRALTAPGSRRRRCTPPSPPCAADLRHRRPLACALARGLPLPRGAPGRPQLRHLPGQRLRGGEPSPGALLPLGHSPGRMERRAALPSAGVPRSRWTCGAPRVEPPQ